MSQCSLILQDQLNELIMNEGIVARLVEENQLKQMAIDKATGLVQSLQDQILLLRGELQQRIARQQRLREELTVYKQELHPKWMAEIREQERIIAELHALIRSQEKEKMEDLYSTHSKNLGFKHRQNPLSMTEDGFGKQRIQKEGFKPIQYTGRQKTLQEQSIEKVKESVLWLREIVKTSEDDSKELQKRPYDQPKRLQSSTKHSQSKSTHCTQPCGSYRTQLKQYHEVTTWNGTPKAPGLKSFERSTRY